MSVSMDESVVRTHDNSITPVPSVGMVLSFNNKFYRLSFIISGHSCYYSNDIVDIIKVNYIADTLSA